MVITDAEKRQQGRKTFAALRHRNYQLFFGGQLISVAGTWMQAIAQGWLVYQLSHSEFALGIVSFASAIPVLFLSTWAGVVVDRVHKRNLLVATQASMMILAFILAALTFSGVVQVWHIIALAALLGLVNTFDAPGRQAFVVEMVGREDMTNAIALNSLMFNGARIIGPALGGLLLATLGSGWCFMINGLSFIAVIAGLLAMQIQPHRPVIVKASSWEQMTSGLRYSRAHSELLAILLMATIFSLFGTSYSTILPAYVDQSLHAGINGASIYGAINAISGLGAVTAALVIASRNSLKNGGIILGFANVFFCSVLLIFGLNHFTVLALILAFGLGIGFMIQYTMMNSLLQTLVSDDMRGRVMSLYTLSIFGFSPLGNLLMGSLSQSWGMSPAISLSALTAAGLSILVFVGIPKVRHVP